MTPKQKSLSIAPEAIIVKCDKEWKIYRSISDITQPVVVAKTANKAWEEAQFALNPNMMAIPFAGGDTVVIKKVGRTYYADREHCPGYYFRWIDKTTKIPPENCTYQVRFEQTSGGSMCGWYWSAYADESNPLYYHFGSYVTFLTKTDAIEDVKDLKRSFNLGKVYEVEEIVTTREIEL